jgi:hypothetical protein
MASVAIDIPDPVPSDYTTALGTLQLLLELKAKGRTSADDKGLLEQVAWHFSQHTKTLPTDDARLWVDVAHGLASATMGARGLLDASGDRPGWLEEDGEKWPGWVIKKSITNVDIKNGDGTVFKGGTWYLEYTHESDGALHSHKVLLTIEKSMGRWLWVDFGRGFKNGIYHFAGAWDGQMAAHGFMLGYKSGVPVDVSTDVDHRAMAVFSPRRPGVYKIMDYDCEQHLFVTRQLGGNTGSKTMAMWVNATSPEEGDRATFFSPSEFVHPNMWVVANNGVEEEVDQANRLICKAWQNTGAVQLEAKGPGGGSPLPRRKKRKLAIEMLAKPKKRMLREVFLAWAQDDEEERAKDPVYKCVRIAIGNVQARLALAMVGNDVATAP